MSTVTKEMHWSTENRRKKVRPGCAPERPKMPGRIPRVSKLMALAIRFDQLLQEGVVADQSELARLARVSQPRMTQIMNLLHLAPDIQEEILFLPLIESGCDPIAERHLRVITRTSEWGQQRRVWAKCRR